MQRERMGERIRMHGDARGVHGKRTRMHGRGVNSARPAQSVGNWVMGRSGSMRNTREEGDGVRNMTRTALIGGPWAART
jgi:hypothetical protein